MDDENQARTPVAIETEEYEDLGEFELEDVLRFQNSAGVRRSDVDTDAEVDHSQRKFDYKLLTINLLRLINLKTSLKRSDCS